MNKLLATLHRIRSPCCAHARIRGELVKCKLCGEQLGFIYWRPSMGHRLFLFSRHQLHKARLSAGFRHML